MTSNRECAHKRMNSAALWVQQEHYVQQQFASNVCSLQSKRIGLWVGTRLDVCGSRSDFCLGLLTCSRSLKMRQVSIACMECLLDSLSAGTFDGGRFR